MKNILIVFLLFPSVTYAQFRSLVINECMPNNTVTVTDQDGEYNDWVEFYNNSNNTINIEGYFLSDRKSEPTKFTFPEIQLSSNNYLIVWLDKDTLQQGLHTNFKLDASSEQLYLFDVDTQLVDYVHFYNLESDVSVARNTDGNGSFEISNPSFNQTNGIKSNGVVINEWMANNTNIQQDEHGEYNDWIELYNNSNQSINIMGYFLSNKANEATKYTFPNIIINAYDYLVLWADEDTLQGNLHLPFKLDSERDDIVFSRPDTSTIDYFFHHNVDSNITMARIPNGSGDIVLGNSTFQTSNLPYVSLNENVENGLKVYPNPCSSYLFLENFDPRLAHIDLTSINGSIIKRFHKPFGNSKIDMSEYKSGVYFIKTSENKSHKIVIIN